MCSAIGFWIQMRKALLSVSVVTESQPLPQTGFRLSSESFQQSQQNRGD